MKKQLSIISWNVNGLRAIHRKGSFELIMQQNTDFMCMQETKVHVDQLDEKILNPKGYVSYFDHSKLKKGYSGIAIYMKDILTTPNKIEYGFGIPKMDQEGRMICLIFDKWALINCYFPNGGGAPERFQYKLDFYKEFLKYCKKLTNKGLSVVFCGDVNVAHEEIDLARPKQNKKSIGFLPEERIWIDKFIEAGYVDVFRELHPHKIDAYTWWDMKTFARERNVGWRIDYFFVSKKIMNQIKSCTIEDDFTGSDHCPVKLVVDNLFQ
ncbi:MAG: exodeoxyribonuclease III [bacterium]